MPPMIGTTLDDIIHASSHRLMVERSVNIIAETCRGLQMAHERGLIHRDMEPSNIFVIDDDSVRIIDFGVVHKSEHHSTKGLKDTLICSRLTVLVTCSLATRQKHGLAVSRQSARRGGTYDDY